MTFLMNRNAKMALQSIRSTKLRSFLTMLGVIIGVASVIVAVGLGEGLRRQVASNIKTVGNDVITVRPGKLVNRDATGKITSVNFLAAIAANSLSEPDYLSLTKLPGLQTIVPLSVISALPSNRDGRQFESTVIGTTPDFPQLLQQKITFGNFFGKGQSDQNVVVIGKTVAEQLFQENVPIGQTMLLRDQEFVVIGIFDKFDGNVITAGGNLNSAVFIPHAVAKSLSGNTGSLYQILVKPDSTTSASVAAASITKKLTANHGGQVDFTVLKQNETLQLAGKTVTMATSFIASIAAISLIVGGIGIMNIMFVSVTERTREIGVRKSLGATNRQIYSQFLIEASVISFVGGIVGIFLALLSDFLLDVLTSLNPVATWPIVGIAVLTATAIGIIFGTVPAIKAARKDPIDSLRYE